MSRKIVPNIRKDVLDCLFQESSVIIQNDLHNTKSFWSIQIISFYCKQFRVIRSFLIVKCINNLFCATIVNIYKIHVFSSRFLNVLVGRYLVGTPRHKEILNVKLLRGHSIFVPANFLVNAISKILKEQNQYQHHLCSLG